MDLTAPPNPLLAASVPSQALSLLSTLHSLSLAQEASLTRADYDPTTINDTMRDKFIALEEDKCHFVFQLARAINAKTIVEAGTSYGVSTIYLALAAIANAKATGGEAKVIGTEHEPTKADKAREHWRQCGTYKGVEVGSVIDLKEGDLRETLKEKLGVVDMLLLDIWAPMALPALKLVQPSMRYGAVVIADNTIGNERYRDLLEYLREPGSGFSNLTVPYNQGLEICVYLPVDDENRD